MKRHRWALALLGILLLAGMGGCWRECTGPGILIVVITSPHDGDAFDAGESIAFMVEVRTQAGAVPHGAVYGWNSDRDGEIGTMATFTRDDLSEGAHMISVTVSDSQGRTGNASVTISIESDPPGSNADRYTLAPGKTPEDVVAMGITDLGAPIPLVAVAWYDDPQVDGGTYSAGSPLDLDAVLAPVDYTLPHRRIVGMGIGSDDHVYAWYSDGTVSSGVGHDLDLYFGPTPYTLAPGKTPQDIVGMAVADDGHGSEITIVFYNDLTMTAGTVYDLDADGDVYEYALPDGREPDDIVGTAFNTQWTSEDEMLLLWFNDSTWSPLKADPPSYSFTAAAGKSAADISGLGMTSNGDVYAWYTDSEVSAGTKWDLDNVQAAYDYDFPAGDRYVIVGAGIDANEDVWFWYENRTMTSAGSMDAAFWVPIAYTLPPGKAPVDVVGMGIASDNVVFVWYDDGTVTAGTATDLDAYRTPYAYTLPAGKTPADIVGMDIDKTTDRCYAWYDNGTVSAGTSSNLDLYEP